MDKIIYRTICVVSFQFSKTKKYVDKETRRIYTDMIMVLFLDGSI